MIEIRMQGTLPGVHRVSRASAPFMVLGCMAVLSSCSAFENGASDRDFQHQVYMGAGVLVSQLEPDTSGVAGASLDESMDSGGSLTLGYDLNNRFSVEGHVASLGEATIDPAGTVGYNVGGISALYHGLNDPRDRSRREGFAAYGRLGLGTMQNDARGVEFERVNDVHLLAGVGLEYGLSNGVGVRAELVAHETDAKYAQLGVVYRFGTHLGSQASPSPGAAVIAGGLVAPSPADDVPTSDATAGEPAPVPVTGQASVKASPPVDSTLSSGGDADGDKVLDSKDQCPDTAAGVPVKADGCPVFGGVMEGVNFRPGSDTLTSEATRVLAEIAETLREYPDVRVVIEAHTDNLGEASVNLQLSKRRAIAVARFLIDAGISGSRLKAKAYGESRPRSTNETAQGRAANRRVEFSILQ